MIYLLLPRTGNPLFVELDPDEVEHLQEKFTHVMRSELEADPIFVFATGGVLDLRTLKGIMPFVPPEYAEGLAMEALLPEMEEQQQLRLAMTLAHAAQHAVREHGSITSMGTVDCDQMVLTKFIHAALQHSFDEEYEDDDDPPSEPGEYQ